MAWDLVKAYSEKLTFYQTGEDNVTKMVKPDWSQMTSDVGFTMIPGQQYNNSLNDDLLSQGTGVSMGNTTRAPLALYPFWSAIFYFSKPIDNIVGIQVGIWGDTKEVAYIDTYGYLGGSWQMSTSDGDAEQTPALISDDSGQTSPAIIQSSQLQTELIIGTVVAAIIVITATSIFVKKKRN
jgi:hypothetical protein